MIAGFAKALIKSSLLWVVLSSIYSPIFNIKFVLFAANKSFLESEIPTAIASKTFEVRPLFKSSLNPFFKSGYEANKLIKVFISLFLTIGISPSEIKDFIISALLISSLSFSKTGISSFEISPSNLSKSTFSKFTVTLFIVLLTLAFVTLSSFNMASS